MRICFNQPSWLFVCPPFTLTVYTKISRETISRYLNWDIAILKNMTITLNYYIEHNKSIILCNAGDSFKCKHIYYLLTILNIIYNHSLTYVVIYLIIILFCKEIAIEMYYFDTKYIAVLKQHTHVFVIYNLS